MATTGFCSQELLGLENLVDQIEPLHQHLVRALPLRERLTGTNAIDNIHGLLLGDGSRL
jgi:hypothetical protein